MGHAGTKQDYYEAVFEFAKHINMIPIRIKKERKNYILNSMLIPFLYSATDLWSQGVADPETIDKTWMLGTGSPTGPFRIIDHLGLPLYNKVRMMEPDYKDPNSLARKTTEKIKEMIDAGKTGKDVGEGFYKYK